MPTLAKTLEKAREKVGITRWRLAKDSGVDAASVHRIETGEQKNITTPTAERLAKVLQIKPSELLGIE